MHVGLRGRQVIVVFSVSVLALAVVAILLLVPLDRLLRESAVDSLVKTVKPDLVTLTRLESDTVKNGDPALIKAARRLHRQSAADIAVFNRRGTRILSTDAEAPLSDFASARTALRTRRTVKTITGQGSDLEVELGIPISIDGKPAAVGVRKPINDVLTVQNVIVRALAVAIAAALIAALLAGLFVAGRMSTRLRRLRDSALRVAEIGPTVELEPDRGHDEIGDLSRAFSTMQTRLQDQEKVRRAFVATASHELRTPLASLQVMLDMLLADLHMQPVDLESARSQAANADRQAGRLALLAAQLLNISRIDAGVPVRTELVDLDAILGAVIAELAIRLTDHDREISRVAGGARWAIGDPGAVAQVLRILLDNALSYTAGIVRVGIEQRDRMVAVVVQDDGPGVAPEDTQRIFDRFERGNSARTGGFGLGLAIGRELAEQMDGRLTLENTDSGARFVLSLQSAPAP